MPEGFTHSTPVPLYWVSHGPPDAERLLVLHGGPGAHHDYLTGALRDVRCPTLVVHGREDPIPLESSRAAAEALDAELVVLDACGHVPYVEQPEALFRAIRSFLDRTSPNRRLTA